MSSHILKNNAVTLSLGRVHNKQCAFLMGSSVWSVLPPKALCLTMKTYLWIIKYLAINPNIAMYVD